MQTKKGHQKGHHIIPWRDNAMLTDTQVAGLRAKDKPYNINDKNPALKPGGLAVRVRPLKSDKTGKGSKDWIYTYTVDNARTGGPQKKRISLGPYPAVSLSQARTKAADKAAELANGIDPQQARQERKETARLAANRATLKQLLEVYLTGLETRAQESGRGAISAKSIRSIVERYVYTHDNLPDMPATEVSSTDISSLLKRTVDNRKQVKRAGVMVDVGSGNKTTQKRLRQALHAAYAEIIRRRFDPALSALDFGEIQYNPVSPVQLEQRGKIAVSVKTKHSLSEDDVRSVWNYLRTTDKNESVIGLVKLCMLTGQRPGDIRQVKWKHWIRKDNRLEIPAEITKNGRDHTVYLGERAQSVLAGLLKVTGSQEHIFAGRIGKSKWTGKPVRAETVSHVVHQISTGAGVAKFDLRGDMRRTWKEMAARSGVSFELRNRIQNHAFTDVSSRVYDKYDYLAEKAHAMAQFEHYFDSMLLEHKEPKVIQIHAHGVSI